MPTATTAPTTPTYLSPAPIPPVVLASGDTLGTRYTLDLRTSRGAWLFPRIGRRVATALTRSAWIICRRTDNDGLVHSSTMNDIETFASTTAGATGTVSSGGAINTNTVTLTGVTGTFNPGDQICLHRDNTSAERLEFARILSVSGSTIAVDRAFRITHEATDRVTNLATVASPMFLTGGDQWEIYAANNSGQSLVFHCEGLVIPGDTTNY